MTSCHRRGRDSKQNDLLTATMFLGGRLAALNDWLSPTRETAFRRNQPSCGDDNPRDARRTRAAGINEVTSGAWKVERRGARDPTVCHLPRPCAGHKRV